MLPQRKKAACMECFYVQSSLYFVTGLALGAETGIFQLAGEWVSLCCLCTEVIILRLLKAPIHCSGYLHAHQKCWLSQSHVISSGCCIAEAFRHLSIKLDPVCDVFHCPTFLFLAASSVLKIIQICDVVILCLLSPSYRKLLFSIPFYIILFQK